MVSRTLLRLADAGFFPRAIERSVRERRFRAFWNNLDDADAPVTVPNGEPSDALPLAATAEAGRARRR